MTKAFDAHSYLGEDKVYGYSQTPQDLIQKMERANIEKALVMPFTGPKLDCLNEYIKKSVGEFPDRLVGFYCVDPSRLDCRKISRAVDNDFRGLYLDVEVYCPFIGLKSKGVDNMAKIAKELQLPILIRNYELSINSINLAEQLHEKAEKFPDVTFIVGMRIPSIKMVATMHENIVMSTSMNKYYEANDFIPVIGPERIIFGSNSPIQDPFVMRKTVDLMPISKHQKRLILRRNLSRILNI